MVHWSERWAWSGCSCKGDELAAGSNVSHLLPVRPNLDQKALERFKIRVRRASQSLDKVKHVWLRRRRLKHVCTRAWKERRQNSSWT
mmetsp:Transcript_20133/g.67248  ORF Transcript_20133/g.67248 Transcript_20133/m.67248 type:complete len:87 (-) Transcript_20133:3404-3664(-)